VIQAAGEGDEMAYWLSEPIEKLIEQFADAPKEKRQPDEDVHAPPESPKTGRIPFCNVLVVGSGYGGAVAAMRLAGPDRSVFVLERGKEYALGDFPENLGEAPGNIRFQRPDTEKLLGNADALFDFRISPHIAALVGNGLGGGSLINANVAIEPDDEVFNRPEWPEKLREQLPKLRESMRSISELLGVTCDPDKPGKMKALQTLVNALWTPESKLPRPTCDPAPIAVTFTGGRNAVGIHQEPCVRCGNCVTGCNVGAKNTLAMNLLPLAKARGARLYTGATVLSVKPEPGPRGKPPRWLVRYRRTATERGPLHDEIHMIRANTVILAAGAFGSTEILLRSRALGDLDCSERLGEGFSGNGDALIFGYGQREPVGCIASGGSLACQNSNVGPTISGVARIQLPETGKNAARRKERRAPGPWPRQITLEDGAVPIILKRIFAELVTSGSLIRRHTKDSVPIWCESHKDADPLGIHEDALAHSQLLLGMGDDGSPGKLVLVPAEEGGWDDARVTVLWRSEGANLARAFQRSLDAAFLFSEGGGFDGGDYIANPVALPLPEDFDGALTGGVPPGMQVTVHPLGGCPMGANSRSGVVNEQGLVWRRRGDKPYDGLYVLDGSIIPVALGVNPFLTIAALADLSAREILKLKTNNWSESELRHAGFESPPRTRTSVPVVEGAVQGKFNERLTGRLDAVPPWLDEQLREVSDYPSNHHWLVADIEISIDSVDELLAKPGLELKATCTLSKRPPRGELQWLAEGHGTVRFFERNPPETRNEVRARAWLAIHAFFQRRKPYIPDTDEGWYRKWTGFFRVAKNHAQWRRMVYQFTFATEKTDRKTNKTEKTEWVVKGTKQLAYQPDRANVWTALTRLPVTVVRRSEEINATRADEYGGMLEVDLEKFTKKAPLQVTASPNLAETIMAMVGVGMLFLRTLFQTHFWSFPAPNYAELAPDVQRSPGDLTTAAIPEGPGKKERAARGRADDLNVSGRRKIKPETVALAVSNAKDSVQIRLIRYANPAASLKQKVLLIHGLAHGACIFTTDTVTTCLAAYLYDRGLEPWLLEHRLSHALPGTAARASNMDDIASGDIATAVDYIYRNNRDAAGRSEPISVFAHCIGAGAFSMAVLGGYCNAGTRDKPLSKIKAAAIHAVPPWVVPSRANRMRANMAAFIKDVIGVGGLDPIPSLKDKVRWDETIIDRIAASLPLATQSDGKYHVIDSERSGMSKDICNRMTLFYGQEWVHENLDPGTHESLASLFGVGNLEVFRHVFFLAQRERITDHEGRDVYLTSDNIRKFWSFPTLFAHGTENKVFDPRSSRRSAVRLENIQKNLRPTDVPTKKCIVQDRDVFIQQVPGYGHMDYIFGREAHIAVYPKLADFFSGDCSQLTRPTPDLDPLEQNAHPLCGPLIGDAQRVDSAKPESGVTLRVWLESNENESSPAGEPTFILHTEDKKEFTTGSKPIAKVEGRYGLYLVYDVVVPKTEARARELEVRLLGRSSPAREKSAAIALDSQWFKRLSEGREPLGCSFLIGSCRHPGSPFERDLCDKVMRAMRDQVRDNVEKRARENFEAVDHVLLVGDQIYADATADAFDTREPGERFVGRYRDLFQSKGFAKLARSVPIRMAIDDHEISNNWPGRNRPNTPTRQTDDDEHLSTDSEHDEEHSERRDQRILEEFEIARESAYCYEALAAPGDRKSEQELGPDKHRRRNRPLWYQFKSGGLPFFVMDCRTQRVQRRRNILPERASMFTGSSGKAQRKALEDWLKAPRDPHQPKFIVSSIPIAPVLTEHVRNPSLWRNADNWVGYPDSLDWLAELFTRLTPSNVVFLSGDYHFSATAHLCFFDAKCREAGAYQVVSSGLYAPMPFANERFEDYSWDRWEATQCAGKETKLGFKASRLSNSQSHFVRVDAKIGADNKWHVDVRAIQADGKETESHRLF
jgi:cholesterol oxidase